jgi:hypothetical protein
MRPLLSAPKARYEGRCEKIWKKMVVVYFKVLSLHVPGETENISGHRGVRQKSELVFPKHEAVALNM